MGFSQHLLLHLDEREPWPKAILGILRIQAIFTTVLRCHILPHTKKLCGA